MNVTLTETGALKAEGLGVTETANVENCAPHTVTTVLALLVGSACEVAVTV